MIEKVKKAKKGAFMNIQNIGFIGTGIMGSSMIRNLMKAGYRLTVYNRTKAKAEALLAEELHEKASEAGFHGMDAPTGAAGSFQLSHVAKKHGLTLDITEAVRNMCQELSDEGEEDHGTQALLKHYVVK
jgi:3-hydroxyisobutyrate dehydrogenase-like beta-hydroxyacid dehydrogenase